MPTWKYLLKSLVSNQAIIDGRKKRWYWALMFFVLSIFLMCVVPLSKGYENHGTSVITPGSDYGISLGLHSLSKNEAFQSLYVENGTLMDHTDSGDVVFTTSTDSDSFFASTKLDTAIVSSSNDVTLPSNENFSFDIEISDDQGNPMSIPVLRVFSSDLEGDALTEQINEKIFRTSLEDSKRPVNRSFIVFTPTDYYLYMYAPLPATTSEDSTDAVASASSQGTIFHGSFSGIDGTFEFADLACTGSYSYSTSTDDNEFLSKWSNFIYRTYKPVRDVAIWTQIGITAGATAGGIILCGLVIWLFTLGRRNLLHRDCTLWQGLKMAATLSFTVAIIGMIAYFFQPVYSYMFGAMGLILRTMWLIMKTNGGGAQSSSKPLYQAR